MTKRSKRGGQKEPHPFDLTEPARTTVAAWIEKATLRPEQCLFPSRLANSPHVSTRQYARIVHQWVSVGFYTRGPDRPALV